MRASFTFIFVLTLSLMPSASRAQTAPNDAAPSNKVLPDAPQPRMLWQDPATATSSVPKKKGWWQKSPVPRSCQPLFISTPEDAPFHGLRSTQKLQLAGCDFTEPFTYIYDLGDASVSTALNSHSKFGPGGRGIAKRFGVDMVSELNDEFWSTYFFPSVFRQDPHYHRLGQGHSKKQRVAYAMSRVLIAKSDDGGSTINAGEMLGTPIESALTNTYYPGISQGWGNTSARVAISIASDSGYNIWKEYSPDVTERFRLQLSFVRRLAEHLAFFRERTP